MQQTDVLGDMLLTHPTALGLSEGPAPAAYAKLGSLVST